MPHATKNCEKTTHAAEDAASSADRQSDSDDGY
jgi:hypothetical protein